MTTAPSRTTTPPKAKPCHPFEATRLVYVPENQSEKLEFIFDLQVSSSGNTSHSSVNRSTGRGVGSSRVLYVNEKRSYRDKTSTVRPRNVHKGSWFSKFCIVERMIS